MAHGNSSGFGNVPGARITAIAQAVVPAPLLPLIALALLSVVLSSADTTLLSSSVILCGLAFRRQKDATHLTEKHKLQVARWVIFGNGIAATFIALQFTNIIGTLLLALAVYAGAFTVPILWGLAGLRCKPKFVGAAILAGGLTALAGKLLPTFGAGISAIPHASDTLLVLAFIVNAILLACGKTNNKN
mgnify:CR=1 FL=1